MWRSTPLEMGEWLMGRNLKSGGVERRHSDAADDYERWAGIFAKSPTASIVLNSTDDYSSFYAVETDIARLIPKSELLDAFYAMKLGFCAPGVPTQFLYVAQQLWEKYKVANLIAPLMPVGMQYCIGRTGYFGNRYTGLDVYRSFLNENINLMQTDKYIVKCGDWYEAYLPALSMVAALPPCIGERLKDEDVHRIFTRAGVGLCLDQTPLTTIGGLKGVCDSVFDLRGAI